MLMRSHSLKNYVLVVMSMMPTMVSADFISDICDEKDCINSCMQYDQNGQRWGFIQYFYDNEKSSLDEGPFHSAPAVVSVEPVEVVSEVMQTLTPEVIEPVVIELVAVDPMDSVSELSQVDTVVSEIEEETVPPLEAPAEQLIEEAVPQGNQIEEVVPTFIQHLLTREVYKYIFVGVSFMAVILAARKLKQLVWA